MSKWLKDALLKRTTLVETRFKSSAIAPSSARVVAFEALDIVIVFKILFSALGGVFRSNRLVISDVYIFQVHLEHSIVSLGQVIQYLCFLLFTLLQVAGTELTSMLQLKNF